MIFLSPRPGNEASSPGFAAGDRSPSRRLDPGIPITVTLAVLSLLILYFGFFSSPFTEFLNTVSAVY